MKFASIFVGLAYAHMEMLTPMPRRSKLFRAAYSGDQIDYNMSAPLDEVEYTYPCRGYAPGPVSAEYTAGQDIPIALHGTANHNGGHCQISISYDNVNYIVIKTIYGDCMVNTLSYSAHLPENAPAGKATLAWTWINRSGNREFYMNCADIRIKGKDDVCLTGKKILIANLENYPTFPEGFANDYGKALFDAQPEASACGKGSTPAYPTVPYYPSAPAYSTPEVPTPVIPSSKPSQAISTTPMASSSQVVVTSSQVIVPTSSQVIVSTSSQVIVPSSSQVVSSSSAPTQPTSKPAHCRPRPTSGMPSVPSSSVNYPTTTFLSSSVVVPTSPASSVVVVPTSPASSVVVVPTSPASSSAPTSPSSSHKPSKCSHKSTATASLPPKSSQMPAPSSTFSYSYPGSSKSSHIASSTIAYPTAMPTSYPISTPGDCVDGTMKCMGPHAIAKCFLKTQYVHACPKGTTCQFLSGYDRCV